MANRKKRSRLNPGEERQRPAGGPAGEGPRFETQVRALALVEELLMQTSQSDPNYGLLELLHHQLRVDEHQLHEAQQALSQFEEVYKKLTSPANRIATYLDSPAEGIAYLSVGEAEYYANVDPNVNLKGLQIGTRVKVNEAFVVIGDLGYSPEGPVVKVAEVLPDGRLRIGGDLPTGAGRIVIRSSQLQDQRLKAGDEVRLEPSFKVAIERFTKAELKEHFLQEIPELPWSKVGGQEEAIKLIRDTIEHPLLYPDLYRRFEKRHLKGILLYGPPGCGKTHIAKATAYNLTKSYRKRTGRDVREYFMFINGPQLLNMWLGETERLVRDIFTQARERAKEGHLVFLFIDEADSLLRTRSSGRYLNIANTVVPQFSAEMDGLVGLENVVVLLTSNRPDYIDPAILRPERIDRKIKIGRPNHQATAEIFGIYLHKRIPLEPARVTEQDGDEPRARRQLIERATDFLFRREPETAFLDVHLRSGRRETLHWKNLVSGALIMSAVERAKELAIERAIETHDEDTGISLDDLERAIRAEYKENEIFPKNDQMEDWLKLLDYEPENVVEVKPAQGRASERTVKSVI